MLDDVDVNWKRGKNFHFPGQPNTLVLVLSAMQLEREISRLTNGFRK